MAEIVPQSDALQIVVHVCPSCGRVATEAGLMCTGTLIGTAVVAEHEPQHMLGVQIAIPPEDLAPARPEKEETP